jgi:hypothetical protein
MAFKLGNEQRGIKTSAIRKKNVGEGTIARANMDGSIDVDPSVKLNSKFGKRVIKHEQAHLDQMQSGRAAYGDDWVMWEDKIYLRREINGKPVIDGPAGRLPEGHEDHPWEAEAIEAEEN